MNKEFERCCTSLAEMIEKYGALVLRDISVEIQYEEYARRFLKQMDKAA